MGLGETVHHAHQSAVRAVEAQQTRIDNTLEMGVSAGLSSVAYRGLLRVRANLLGALDVVGHAETQSTNRQIHVQETIIEE